MTQTTKKLSVQLTKEQAQIRKASRQYAEESRWVIVTGRRKDGKYYKFSLQARNKHDILLYLLKERIRHEYWGLSFGYYISIDGQKLTKEEIQEVCQEVYESFLIKRPQGVDEDFVVSLEKIQEVGNKYFKTV